MYKGIPYIQVVSVVVAVVLRRPRWWGYVEHVDHVDHCRSVDVLFVF